MSMDNYDYIFGDKLVKESIEENSNSSEGETVNQENGATDAPESSDSAENADNQAPQISYLQATQYVSMFIVSYFAQYHIETKDDDATPILEYRSQDGGTVLHLLPEIAKQHSQLKDQEIAKFIKCIQVIGIDINHQDDNGNTALHYCAQHSSISCMKRLEQAKDILTDIKNEECHTPLFVAVQRSNDLNSQKIFTISGRTHAYSQTER